MSEQLSPADLDLYNPFQDTATGKSSLEHVGLLLSVMAGIFTVKRKDQKRCKRENAFLWIVSFYSENLQIFCMLMLGCMHIHEVYCYQTIKEISNETVSLLDKSNDERKSAK